MLNKLIEKFYDEDGFLKDEVIVKFSQKAMIEIIKECVSLKLGITEEEER